MSSVKLALLYRTVVTINHLERPLQLFADPVHTITAVNGKKFVYYEEMTAQLKCGVYFAEPNVLWQRGLNESANGLLRHYERKSTYSNKVSVKDVRVKLNDRTRKKLN